MFKPSFKFSWEKLKANTKYRDVLSNVGGSVWVLYSHETWNNLIPEAEAVLLSNTTQNADTWRKTFVTVSFQTSLNKLLETLGRAEPFFIRCIRSNAEKVRLPTEIQGTSLGISLFQLVPYHSVCRWKVTKVWREICCACDSSWAPQALTGCFLLMFYRRRCSLMRAWCCSSYGTRACWKLCGSGDLATVPNTHSRYSGKWKWIVLSGISALFRKHVLCVSPHKAHDHLGWTVKMHSSFERACIAKSCI